MSRRGGSSVSGHSLRARLATYWPLLLVLAVVLYAAERVFTEHWRQGSAWIGAAALLAAALRVLLPSDRVGLLAIRGRAADAICYGGFGLVVLLLAFTITQGSLTVS